MTVSDSERRFIMTDGGISEQPTEWSVRWRSAKEKARRWNSHCPNSWLGSHKFEPRYDIGPADLTGIKNFGGKATSTLKFLDRLRKQTYIRDVCVKCGKTIEREVMK